MSTVTDLPGPHRTCHSLSATWHMGNTHHSDILSVFLPDQMPVHANAETVIIMAFPLILMDTVIICSYIVPLEAVHVECDKRLIVS